MACEVRQWFMQAGVALVLSSLVSAANVVIVNNNAAGVGLNDPTAAAPIGGNAGTTVGEQRLIALQHAANIWGAALESNVEIRIRAQFIALTCSESSAVLGSASAAGLFSDFANAEFLATWYHAALANKRAGTDLDTNANDINSNFNVNIGTAGCFTNVTWYYGLDTSQGPNQVNLVAVALHEFAHGLGFSQFASTTTGAQNSDMTDVYGRRLFDKTQNKFWNEMTDAERVTSAVNSGNVVWTGTNVTMAAPKVLASGTPLLQITAPEAIARNYAIGTASFGAPVTATSGAMLLATDAADGEGPTTTDACTTITNGTQLSGKIALVDRGTCTFVVKAKNVQNAGAIAMVVVDNVAGSPPPGLGGTDPSIGIPAVRITLADGNTIKAQLAIPAAVNGNLVLNMNQLAGADTQNRLLLNTPDPVQPGSSISHWDPSTLRNQLMEPAINANLTHSVKEPEDLTLALFKDIGWAAAAPPPAALSSLTLDFGKSLIGHGARVSSIRFNNPEIVAVNIASIMLNITGSSEFSRTHDCPNTLAVASYCTITVQYASVMPGLQTTGLTIHSSAPGSPHVVSIWGTGVTDLVFSLSRTQRPGRNAGGAANVFELAIRPASGFEGLVTLGCSGKEADIGCTIRPGSVFVAGAPVTATVTVQVAGRSLRLRRNAGSVSRTIRVKATVGGASRTIELPVTIAR